MRAPDRAVLASFRVATVVLMVLKGGGGREVAFYYSLSWVGLGCVGKVRGLVVREGGGVECAKEAG